jgi:hypothetical protein
MRGSLLLVPLIPLLAAGCIHRGGGMDTANALTVCIENAAAGYGNITAHVELTRYDVMPGQTVCKRVNTASPRARLTAITMGGGAAGPIRYAMELPSSAPGCWRWRLGASQASQTDLVPCPEDPMGS